MNVHEIREAKILIRKYDHDKDFEACQAMLDAEGVPRRIHFFCETETYVLEEDWKIKGFFSFIHHYDLDPPACYPCLSHFCVEKSARDGRAGRLMVKAFVAIMLERGVNFFTTNAPANKPANKKAIEYMFRVKPYGLRNREYWYLVPISKVVGQQWRAS